MRAPTFKEFCESMNELFERLAAIGIHNPEELAERINQIEAERRCSMPTYEELAKLADELATALLAVMECCDVRDVDENSDIHEDWLAVKKAREALAAYNAIRGKP